MVFQVDENFWKVNSFFLTLETFASLYEKDTSENKEASSKLMWALSLCVNPQSPIYSVLTRWDQVKKTILANPKFNWNSKENKKLIEDYKDVVLTVADKSYMFWCEHMKKREEFANSVDYKTADDRRIELVESILSKTPKLYDELDRIKKQLSADMTLSKSKPVSESDSGKI